MKGVEGVLTRRVKIVVDVIHNNVPFSCAVSMFNAMASSLDETTVTLLLEYARTGDDIKLAELLDTAEVDLNAKGQQKKNYGWSALHLAAYFGHETIVKMLVDRGADIGALNFTGDTPLHKAVLSNRMTIARTLLAAGADVNIVNADGVTAADLAKESELSTLLEAAAKSDLLRLERKLLDAAREGKIEDVFRLLPYSQPTSTVSQHLSCTSNISSAYLKSGSILSVNCADDLGNRPLHFAALTGNKETIIALLQLGADPQLVNKRGLRAVDLTRDPRLKEILEIRSLKEMSNSAKRVEGTLLRKSRLRGFRDYWVVLENGTLSLYFNREAEISKKREKSGRFLAGAKMEGDCGKDAFTLRFSNKSKIIFAVPKRENELFERQKWINAFRDHIGHANKILDVELKRANEDEESEKTASLGSLQSNIENIRAYDQLLRRQLEDINKSLAHIKQEICTLSGLPPKLQDLFQGLDGKVSQLVKLSNQMCSDLSSCVNIMSQREEFYRKDIEEEKRRNKILEESLQAVAKEAKHLETSLQTVRSNSILHGTSMEGVGNAKSPLTKTEGDSEEDSNDEMLFYDCPSPDIIPGSSFSPDNIPQTSGEEINNAGANFEAAAKKSTHTYRKVLPVTSYSRKVSIWTILKHCIGKDLSKITMPIVLNEPLSFLQKQAEYFEYCYLLHRACDSDNAVERMENVAAFVVSTISSSVDRIAKPFNPLLGETYELTRPELGFRICNEQVSHHPPISAFYAESVGRSDGGFKASGSMCPKIKFWGKSIEVQPKGLHLVELLPFKEVYTWETVKVAVHNIIIGRVWLEYVGRCDIVCHQSGLRCSIDFKSAGWFGELHRIEGTIYSKKNEKLRCVYGKWTEVLYSVPVDVWSDHQQGVSPSFKSSTENGQPGASASGGGSDSEGAVGGSTEELDVAPQSTPCDLNLPGQKLVWRAIPIPEYCKDYFYFSPLAMQLNEPPSPELREIIPKTDSRLRPDIRLLEDGDIDMAASAKHRLEEKQRHVRKKMQEKKQEWKPRWFKLEPCPYSRSNEWSYNGDYWKRDFVNCPEIFE